MQKEEKKILIITPGFAKDEQDSSAVPYLQDYLLALKNKIGEENIIILSIHYPYTKKRYTWNGITVIPCNGKNKKGLQKLFLMYRIFSKLKKLYKTSSYIVHSFWLTDATMIGHIIRKKNNVKHIATAMGQDVKPGNKIFYFLEPDETTIVLLSKNQNDEYVETTGRHANCIIPMPLPEINKQEISAERDIDFLFVSSYIPLKNPVLFIFIMKKLREKFRNINAVMLGGGPMMEKMQEVITAEKLDDTITLCGKQTRQEVFAYMRRSKILLHTSEYEGQCLVFAEALAHGMYVVSRHVGRVEDSDKHVIGWNEEELFLHCEKLLQCKMHFEPYQSLNTNEIVQQYIELYNS